jgi:hypothetical protein
MGGGFADAGEDHSRDQRRLYRGSVASPAASCLWLHAIACSLWRHRLANPFSKRRGNPEALVRAPSQRASRRVDGLRDVADWVVRSGRITITV